MTTQNLDAPEPTDDLLATEVQAFACRIPVDMAACAADIYERAMQASADLLSALLDREEMASQVERLYRPDKPHGIEGGDWLVAIEEHIGLGAALRVLMGAAGWVQEVTCSSVDPSLMDDLRWPETAWPLSFPRERDQPK